MRKEKGRGMSDEQVVNFINGCKKFRSNRIGRESFADIEADYPAYELYTDVLRNGIFGSEKGKQLRLLVDKNRRVKDVQQI